MEALAALERLLPVALAFGCGVLFASRRIVPAANSKAFADYAFLFGVPCYLFRNIYTSDLGTLFNWPAITGYAVTALCCLVVVGLAAYLFSTREPRGIALRAMAGVQVNTAYFAIPVFIMLFGNAAPIFPVLLFQVCVLSMILISVMEFGGTEAASGPGRRLARAIWASLNTPVVLACNAAILLNLLAVKVPEVLLDGFSYVGDSASPVALFALGLYLGGAGLTIRGTSLEEIWLIAFKCVAFPLITLLVGRYVFHIGGEWLTYLVLIAAMPAPQNLFIYSQRYGVGIDLSAALVVKSSIGALLLLPLWVQWAQPGG